jgi:hypothetical protein
MGIPRTLVYEMLTKEDAYAQGWAKGKKDAYTSRSTGQPFQYTDWLVFAEKYFNEAKLCYANYTPDLRAIRSRMLKAASLLVSGLQTLGEETDLRDIAGVSSNKYPIFHGGLQTFNQVRTQFNDSHIQKLQSNE